MKCAKDGCRANAMTKSSDNRCYFHSRDTRSAHKESTRAGGSHGGVFDRGDPVKVETIEDVKTVLEEAVNAIRKSGAQNTVARVRCLAYVCQILAGIITSHDLEQRLQSLEDRLELAQDAR